MDSNPTPDRVEKATTLRRKPHSARGSHLLFLAFSTLGEFSSLFLWRIVPPSLISYPGIIYSDIGTSPLYVLNGIWVASGPAPSREDVIGGISAIIWAMTLMPLLKYVSAPHM